MSFQKNRSDDGGIEGARWLACHRSELTSAGVPDEIAGSARRWNYVLLHGDDELQSGWRAEWLTTTQAGRLLRLLEPNLKTATGFDLVRRLKANIESTSSDAVQATEPSDEREPE